MTGEPNEIVIWQVYQDDQGNRCQRPIGEISLDGKEYAEGEVVMQLMEAAPKLLSALRWLVDLKDEPPPGYVEPKSLAWAAARAAIKEAVGECPPQMPNSKENGTSMKRTSRDICKMIAEIDEKIKIHQMPNELRQEDDQKGAQKLMIGSVRSDLMEAAVCLKAIGERELSIELWAVIAKMMGDN